MIPCRQAHGARRSDDLRSQPIIFRHVTVDFTEIRAMHDWDVATSKDG